MCSLKRDFSRNVKVVIVGAALVFAAGLHSCKKSEPPANRSEQPTAPQAPPAAPGQPSVTPVDSKVIERKSPFDHLRKEHAQECSYCHKRVDNETIPDFPRHESCNYCHQKDFTNVSSQMCAVCHAMPINDVEPKLISFPGRLDEFGLKGFSHKDHMNPQKMPAGSEPLTCADCHRFDSQGVNVSFPRHAECYKCHTYEAGEKLSNCGTCHVDQKIAMKYEAGLGAALTLYNFKHRSHLKQARCDSCHKLVETDADKMRSDVAQISTARGQKHTSTCWSCHKQAREPVCTKCHVGALPF
jgi:hypothetical protein